MRRVDSSIIFISKIPNSQIFITNIGIIHRSTYRIRRSIPLLLSLRYFLWYPFCSTWWESRCTRERFCRLHRAM